MGLDRVGSAWRLRDFALRLLRSWVLGCLRCFVRKGSDVGPCNGLCSCSPFWDIDMRIFTFHNLGRLSIIGFLESGIGLS